MLWSSVEYSHLNDEDISRDMGHLGNISENIYQELICRLNEYQVGAPDTVEIHEILRILFTKEEAYVGSKFILGPLTIDELSAKTDIPQAQLAQILESMAQKGLVIDTTCRGRKYFVLTPTVFGFFEFTFMKINKDLPMRRVAELMEAAFDKEMGAEFFGSRTQMARALAYEMNLGEITSSVMTYDQVSEIIRQSSARSLQTCFCRSKAGHLNKGCAAPVENICMGLGPTAEFLARRGFARKASAAEMLHVLDKAEKLGLVHTTDNIKQNPTFICHCCRCCCELLAGINKRNIPNSLVPSNFMVQIDYTRCSKCGVCAKRCPVGAMTHSAEPEGRRQLYYDRERCLGCSVCVSGCERQAIKLTGRPRKPHIPQNYLTRHMKIAREKGRLRPTISYIISTVLKGRVRDNIRLAGLRFGL